jgi:hypothetical protein
MPKGRSTVKLSRINAFSQLENHRIDATLGPVKHADGWRCCGFKRLAVERLDVSQSRVPAVPQQCQVPEAAAGHACWVAFRMKEGFGQAKILPVRRAEAASNHHPRERMQNP